MIDKLVELPAREDLKLGISPDIKSWPVSWHVSWQFRCATREYRLQLRPKDLCLTSFVPRYDARANFVPGEAPTIEELMVDAQSAQ